MRLEDATSLYYWMQRHRVLEASVDGVCLVLDSGAFVDDVEPSQDLVITTTSAPPAPHPYENEHTYASRRVPRLKRRNV